MLKYLVSLPEMRHAHVKNREVLEFFKPLSIVAAIMPNKIFEMWVGTFPKKVLNSFLVSLMNGKC
jgi:hypothetical protein